jgi:hypothetical protein
VINYSNPIAPFVRLLIRSIHQKYFTIVFVLCAVFSVRFAAAQTPGLLWTTNIGARLFAVDAQTNVYANSGGTVFILNSAGVPLQTNVICPRSGLAQRDTNGDYYFAGVMPSHVNASGISVDFDAQDFGGIVLSNQAVYLAKYSSGGGLLWAKGLGPGNGVVRNNVQPGISVNDFLLDDNGNVFVGYSYYSSTLSHSSYLERFDIQGSNYWSAGVPQNAFFHTIHGYVRAGAFSATNGFVLEYSSVPDSP